MDWNTAVDAWLAFQSRFGYSNAIIVLLIDAINFQKDEKNKEFSNLIYFFLIFLVLHKAKNFWKPSRVNAFHACALSVSTNINGLKEAEELFKNPNVCI